MKLGADLARANANTRIECEKAACLAEAAGQDHLAGLFRQAGGQKFYVQTAIEAKIRIYDLATEVERHVRNCDWDKLPETLQDMQEMVGALFVLEAMEQRISQLQQI